MKGVNHYKRDGTLHTGGTHKMPDGSLHSGKKHGKTSVKLYHYKDLSATAKKRRDTKAGKQFSSQPKKVSKGGALKKPKPKRGARGRA